MHYGYVFYKDKRMRKSILLLLLIFHWWGSVVLWISFCLTKIWKKTLILRKHWVYLIKKDVQSKLYIKDTRGNLKCVLYEQIKIYWWRKCVYPLLIVISYIEVPFKAGLIVHVWMIFRISWPFCFKFTPSLTRTV